jgi:hypothetical protein
VLSGSKVVAGGLAAATTAVLGSYFGVLGTVGGAAATSVVTALSSELYQRSLQRTGNRLRSKTGRAPDQRDTEPPTTGATVPSRGHLLPRVAFVSLVIFALGIGVVSGVESVRGAPLSGGSGGTSIGDVLHGTVPPLLGPVVGSNQHSDNPSDNGSTDRRAPGLVNGLLSGL